MSGCKYNLLVLDIDNTVFDWVNYYVNCLWKMLDKVSELTGIDSNILAVECKRVFTEEDSIEYPFVIQQLPSVVTYYDGDADRLLNEAVSEGRQSFLSASKDYLIAYDGVVQTMAELATLFPDLKVVALTDAPRYVAMWKLNKLQLLHYFDSIYGLGDPRIPVSADGKRALVSEEILIKHLRGTQFQFKGSVRILPDEYEKPGKRGLKTILMDYNLDEDRTLWKKVLWVGDNVGKDIGLGNSMGIATGWAKYGTGLPPSLMERLKLFSPDVNVRKNISVSTTLKGYNPTYTLSKFGDILDILKPC